MDEPAAPTRAESTGDPIAIPRNRGGSPLMRRGMPSLNPRGRPRASESLARAIREKWPAARIVELAEKLLETSTSERVKLGVLQLLALRAYGIPRAPVAKEPLSVELAQGVDG